MKGGDIMTNYIKPQVKIGKCTQIEISGHKTKCNALAANISFEGI